MKKTTMKKITRLFIVLTFALAMMLPASVFAAAAPPPDTSGGAIQVEIRYKDGETPDIPQQINQFGFTYNLVSVSDPVLESELPTVRTYTYQVDGALTPEQVNNIKGLGDLKLSPVDIIYEEEVDKVATIPMKTNDVDDVPKIMKFTVTSGEHPSGFEEKDLTLVGVTFELANPKYDSRGLPAGYVATAVYRGIQTYSDLGYYIAEATFVTYEDEEDGIEAYVVVASYVTDEMPPPVDEEEEEEALIESLPVPPEGTGTGLSEIDDGLVALQGPNLIQNLIDGLVPLGGMNVAGVWSFLSFILAAAAIAMAAVFAIGVLVRKKRVTALTKLGVEEERLVMIKRRGIILRILTIIFGLITLVSWIFLDNFGFGMVWINETTMTVGILLIVTAALCIFTNMRSKRIMDDDSESDGFTAEYTTA